MKFEVPEQATDTATQLRELEPKAPKHLKPVLEQAAKELDRWHHVAANAVVTLEEAANVRISQMATTSKVEEVQAAVRSSLRDLAMQLRGLL
jgi:hypothetical protein